MKAYVTAPQNENIENICINCPGSLWGEKSICRVHNKSIGEIEDCYEWHKPSLSLQNNQVSFLDIEPAIEIVQKTEEDVKNYHWMVKEVSRIEKVLYKASSNKSWGVAQYGIEAAMPKGSPGKSQIEMDKLDEKEKRLYKKKMKFENKIALINKAAEQIKGDKEKTVLDCLLEGERIKTIQGHLGISRQRINELKHSIIKQVAWVLYEDELTR